MTSEHEDSAELDPVDLLVEDYAQLCRSGEPPSIEDYAAHHSAFAGELRRLLPAVAFLERGKRSGSGPGSGSSWKAGVDPDPAPVPAPMQRLGENRVVREIGRGGMGVVYEAIQEPLGRPVAVKVLIRRAHGDAMSKKRFLREIQLVATLDHPGIVPIYSGGEHDGVPYYVMALVDGVGLDQCLADPSSPPSKYPIERAHWAARLILQATEALAYAHGQGVLHRDIKPANLLLDDSGKVWLADFGLAKLADDLSLTGSGELPGTLRYLAPECLHGEADERSDLYSLGLTLYELLVGQPAFTESNWARLLQQVGKSEPPAPSKVVPGVPKALEAIVLKATEREPADRYQTAGALAHDLKRFLDGDFVGPDRPSSAQRLVRWTRRNRVVALLGATTIVLALMTAYFGALWIMGPPPPPPPDGPPGMRGDDRGPPDRRPPPPPKKKFRPPPPFPR